MPHASRLLAAALTVAATLALPLLAQEKPRTAGPVEGGFLLPNGWTITPAGEQVVLTDLPLNILPLADGRHALVASNGYNDHELSLVDLAEKEVVARQNVRQSWFGLAHDPATDRLWWAGGGSGIAPCLHPEGARTRAHRARRARRPGTDQGGARPPSPGARPSRAGSRSTRPPRSSTRSTSTPAPSPPSTPRARPPSGPPTIGGRPYDVAVARNGSRLYVSDWAGRAVLAIDPADLRVVAQDRRRRAPQPDRRPPQGRPPLRRLRLEQQRRRDRHDQGVPSSRRSRPASSPGPPRGARPTPWPSAPTARRSTSPTPTTTASPSSTSPCRPRARSRASSRPAGIRRPSPSRPTARRLLVGVGKGNQTRPNPIDPDYQKKVDERRRPRPRAISPRASGPIRPFPYIGTTLSGALSIVPVPDDKGLAAYTETVYKNCPYSDKLLTDAPYAGKTAIPTKVGDPSPIKHVIYIIKENRTYDQVFGDIERATATRPW